MEKFDISYFKVGMRIEIGRVINIKPTLEYKSTFTICDVDEYGIYLCANGDYGKDEPESAHFSFQYSEKMLESGIWKIDDVYLRKMKLDNLSDI